VSLCLLDGQEVAKCHHLDAPTVRQLIYDMRHFSILDHDLRPSTFIQYQLFMQEYVEFAAKDALGEWKVPALHLIRVMSGVWRAIERRRLGCRNPDGSALLYTAFTQAWDLARWYAIYLVIWNTGLRADKNGLIVWPALTVEKVDDLLNRFSAPRSDNPAPDKLPMYERPEAGRLPSFIHLLNEEVKERLHIGQTMIRNTSALSLPKHYAGRGKIHTPTPPTPNRA
jgi:hypothetical protein